MMLLGWSGWVEMDGRLGLRGEKGFVCEEEGVLMDVKLHMVIRMVSPEVEGTVWRKSR